MMIYFTGDETKLSLGSQKMAFASGFCQPLEKQRKMTILSEVRIISSAILT